MTDYGIKQDSASTLSHRSDLDTEIPMDHQKLAQLTRVARSDKYIQIALIYMYN